MLDLDFNSSYQIDMDIDMGKRILWRQVVPIVIIEVPQGYMLILEATQGPHLLKMYIYDMSPLCWDMHLLTLVTCMDRT